MAGGVARRERERTEAAGFAYPAAVAAFDPARPSGVRLERARGRATVGFALRDGATRLVDLDQRGQAKIRLPRVHSGVPEAVILNTAGGLTGGDRFETRVEVGPGARAVATSQAAERLYRARPGETPAMVENRLVAGAGATLAWVPQETIAFDGARLDRRLAIDMAADATVLAAETVVLGRAAMGETVADLSLVDRIRLVRAGRLVHADATRLVGDPRGILAGGATGRVGGRAAAAFATLLLAAPDAESRLEEARETAAACRSEVGVSAFDGLLAVRLIAPDGSTARADMVMLLSRFARASLPRVWAI